MPNNYEKLMSEEEKINVYYATDLINNGADFAYEWNIGHQTKKKDINSLSKTLKYISDNNLEITFPNIKKVMSILLTTSATSVSEERANSAFRFIKTDYRSTISEDRFNALFCCMRIGT